MNSVPYQEHVPEMSLITPISFFLFCEGGMFPCNVHDDVIEIHACFKKEYRGRYAVEAAKSAFNWIFSNTFFNVIFAEPNNTTTARYAAMCGMKRVNNRFEVHR